VSTKHWRTILVVVTNPFAREQLAATKAAAAAVTNATLPASV
jgi:hypothetical protein